MKTAIKLTTSLISIFLLAAPAGAYSTVSKASNDEVPITKNINYELLNNEEKSQPALILTCAYRTCSKLPKFKENVHKTRSSLILPKRPLEKHI